MSEASGSGYFCGILIWLAHISMYWYVNFSIATVILMYKANISSLVIWNRTLRKFPKLANGQTLENYFTGVEMANEVSQDPVFHICVTSTITCIAMIYRSYAFVIGELNVFLWRSHSGSD